MKKRILQIALASMFIFYASCSNESDVITQESGTNSSIVKSGGLSQTELEDAIRLYNDMIETTEYKAFDLLLEEFNWKMNVENENMPTFVSKDEAMIWINNNLARTNFSSISEFESDYDNLTGAMGNIMSNNMGLYDAFSGATLDQTIEIMNPKNPSVEYPTGPNACELGCIISYDNDRQAAESDYSIAMALINGAENLGGNKEALALARQTATKLYRSKLNNLIYEFNGCIEGCGG